jgi:hypothetical protein
MSRRTLPVLARNAILDVNDCKEGAASLLMSGNRQDIQHRTMTLI